MESTRGVNPLKDLWWRIVDSGATAKLTVILIIVVISAFLALALQGQQKPDTVATIDIEPQGLYELVYESPVGVRLYGWSITHDDARDSFVGIDDGSLVIKATFVPSAKSKSVVAEKEVDVDVSSYNAFRITLNAEPGTRYGIRLIGLGDDGVVHPLWKDEIRTLEHRIGSGGDITLTVDLPSLIEQTTSARILKIIAIQAYMEATAAEAREARLTIKSVEFLQSRLKNVSLPFEGSAGVLILPFSNDQKPPETVLRTVYLILDSNGTSDLRMRPYIVQGQEISSGFLYLPAKNIVAAIHTFPQSSTTILVEYPRPPGSFDGMVIFKAESGKIESFDINLFRLIYLKDTASPTPEDKQLIFYSFAYSILFLFIIPAVVLAVLYHQFVRSRIKITGKHLFLVLLIGVVVRLALMPITSHSFDTSLWALSSRLWFEGNKYGLFEIGTMPILYLILISGYSFYALSRVLGLNDSPFLYHIPNMMENIFLKLPFLIGDIITFLALMKLVGSYYREDDPEALFYSSAYFLAPLTIYLSSMWGMYDSLMLGFLVFGLYMFKRSQATTAVSFIISGAFKLAGFIAYFYLLVYQLLTRRINLLKSIGVGIPAFFATVILPHLIGSDAGLNFYLSFIPRVLGTSNTVSRSSYSPLHQLAPSLSFLWDYTHYIGLILGTIYIVIATRRKVDFRIAVARSMLILFLFVNLSSAAEPQFLIWFVPLLLYLAYSEDKPGILGYTIFYTFIAPFIIMAHTQTFGYLITGVNMRIVEFYGLIPNELFVYLMTVPALLSFSIAMIFLRRRWSATLISLITVLLYAETLFLVSRGWYVQI